MTNAYGLSDKGSPDTYDRPGTTHSYRYGYLIGDGEPRLCGQVSEPADAAKKARWEADKVREALRGLSAPTDVSWWTQKRSTTTTVEYAEPKVDVLP